MDINGQFFFGVTPGDAGPLEQIATYIGAKAHLRRVDRVDRAHRLPRADQSRIRIRGPSWPFPGPSREDFLLRFQPLSDCLSSSAGGEPNHMTTDIFVNVLALPQALTASESVTQRGIENRSQITSNFTAYSGPWGGPVCHLG